MSKKKSAAQIGRLNGLEFYFWSLVGTGGGLEIAFAIHVEKTGHQVVRKLPDVEVVGLGELVEAVALHVDAVLGAFELSLKLEEVLVGFEVWVFFPCSPASGPKRWIADPERPGRP